MCVVPWFDLKFREMTLSEEWRRDCRETESEVAYTTRRLLEIVSVSLVSSWMGGPLSDKVLARWPVPTYCRLSISLEHWVQIVGNKSNSVPQKFTEKESRKEVYVLKM